MKTNRILMRLLQFAFLGVMVVFGMSFLPTSKNAAHASVATGTCYFSNTSCSTGNPILIGTNDVLTGSSAGGNGTRVGNALQPSDYANPKALMSHIEYLYDHGNAQDKRGAAYLMNLIVQAGTGGSNPGKNATPTAGSIVRNEFERRMMNPLVTLTAPAPKDLSETSFYSPSSGDDFLDTGYATTGRLVIEIKYNNLDVFDIEIACGNYSGGFGLPLAPQIDPAVNIFADAGAPPCSVAGTSSYGVTDNILIRCPAGSNHFHWDHIVQVAVSEYWGPIPFEIWEKQDAGPWKVIVTLRNYNGHNSGLVYPSISSVVPNGHKLCEQITLDPSNVLNNNLFNPPGNRSARACVSVDAAAPTPWAVTPSINLGGTSTLPNGHQYVASGTTIKVNYALRENGYVSPSLQSVVSSTPGAPAAVASATPYRAAPITLLNPNQDSASYYRSTITGVEGSSVCFIHTVTPGSSDLPSASSESACVWIFATSGPTVATNGSDVHASTSCGLPSNSATIPVVGISTNPGSYGKYIVTSSGSIGGFTSNGTPGNTNATASGYTTVCRPDLWAEANARYPNSNNIASSFDVKDKVGVFRFAGDVTIFGTVSKKITIISPGVVSIAAPGITVSGSGVYKRTTVPSIGVIAKGGINIDHSVTNVDAYLFSDGLINTCYQSTIAVCDHMLTVNGFLMGHKLRLNRTGLFNSPGAISPVGETINMTGQLYLNPPAVFDLPGSFNFLQSLGERPPLN